MESADVDYLAASVCPAVTTDNVRQFCCATRRAGTARRTIESPVRGSSLPCLCSWGFTLRYSHLVLLIICSLFVRIYLNTSSIAVQGLGVQGIGVLLIDLYILECIPPWVCDGEVAVARIRVAVYSTHQAEADAVVFT